MCPPHARDVIDFFNFDSSATKPRYESVIIGASQRWMRLARGPEVLLDADVNLYVTTGEPHTTARGEQWRLDDLSHPQQLSVETSRRIFTARRRGQLHMINRNKGIAIHTCDVTLPTEPAICLLESK